MRITLWFDAGLLQLVAEDGRSILVQSDWDFPKAASLFGFVPCPCGQTDGTIRCPHRAPREMIAEALAFLLEHVDRSVEDPGYFEKEEPMKICKYCGTALATATTLSDEFCSDSCHAKWINLPFSLCCQYCDAGTNMLNEQQALAEGWIEIEADPEGLGWNFLGVCPECIEQHLR